MSDAPRRPADNARPHLGVTFTCCKVYTRIYLNAAGNAYVGWCPRCAARLEVKVSAHGSDARFFEAG